MLNLSSVTTSNLTTTPTSQSEDDDPRELYQTVIAVIFLLITMTVAFFGNIIVIAVIFMYRTLRQDISNMLLVNLSITDLANTLFVMMSALVSLILDEWPYGRFWCDCVCAINYCLIIVSMLTLCEISIDRYQAVMHPLSYISRVTRRRLLTAIIYTWIQGMAFGLVPPVLNWVAYDYWEAICAIQWHLNRPPSLIYVIIAFMLCFLGPGIVLIYCYVKILKEVKKQKTSAAPSHDSKAKKQRASETQRIMWSLIVVVFAYFICTTPFSLTKLIKVSVSDQKLMPGSVNLTASLLGYVASAINPLVYGIFRRDFRKAYIRFIKVTLLNYKHRQTLSQTNLRPNASITLSGANNVTFHHTDQSNIPKSAQNSPKLKSNQASESLRRKAVQNSFKLSAEDLVNGTKANTNDSNQNLTITVHKQIRSIPRDTNTEHNLQESLSNHITNLADINVIQLKPENDKHKGHIPENNKHNGHIPENDKHNGHIPNGKDNCFEASSQKLCETLPKEAITVDSNQITETSISNSPGTNEGIAEVQITNTERHDTKNHVSETRAIPVIKIDTVDANDTEICDTDISSTEESTVIQQEPHNTNSTVDADRIALREESTVVQQKLHNANSAVEADSTALTEESTIIQQELHKTNSAVNADGTILTETDTIHDAMESVLKEDITHKHMESETVLTVIGDTDVITDIQSSIEVDQGTIHKACNDTTSQHPNQDSTHDEVWNSIRETKVEDQVDKCLGSVVSCRHILVQPVNPNSSLHC